MGIRVKEVRLVDEEGEMLGVVSTDDARAKARAAGLDLVEISPKATPPVCKIIDYGKFQYEQKKKEKLQKKASKAQEIKGIRLSFRIGPGDLQRQKEHAEAFLKDKHPVRVQMLLRGREKAHKDLAAEKLQAFIASLSESGKPDQVAKFSGSQFIVLLKPVVQKSS
jgi:translation initiation factor IF-3